MVFQADGFDVSAEGLVATITINRPEKKNALTQAMWNGMADIFDQIAGNNGVRAVLLRGAGNDFCAGADIGEFAAVRAGSATAQDYERANCRAFSAIRDCPVPVIAAIDGTCFGGGFGIAAACDLRIATPEARFAVPAAKLGLAYPASAIGDIVDAVGVQIAKSLIFSARHLDAAAALEAGFLLKVTERTDMFAAAGRMANEIAKNAPLSIRASKAAIRAVRSGSPDDRDRAEAIGRATFDSEDYTEGRQAFAERRQPDFRGK